MTNIKSTHRKRSVSKAASVAIAATVEKARGRVLVELSLLTESRGGRLTGEQVAAVAAVLSYAVPPDELTSVLAQWLELRNANPGAASDWATSSAGVALLAAARGDDRGRRDLSADAMRRVFVVTDDEAERLQLTALAPEWLRSRQRRRAEGVGPRRKRAEDGERPGKKEGLSRAGLYRLKAAQKAAQAAADGPAEPVQRAAALAADDEAVDLGRFIRPPVPELTAAQRVARLPTSEGRRYASAAFAKGLKWSKDYRGPDDPWYWFDLPAEDGSDEDHRVRAVLLPLMLDARKAAARREAIAVTRARRRAEDHVDDPPPARPDSTARPAQVSEAVWEQVPKDMCAEVVRLAGRHFLHGMSPDDAVAVSLLQVRRERSRAALVALACPEAPAAAVAAAATRWWRAPREEAAARAVAELQAELAAANHETARRAALRPGVERRLAAVMATGSLTEVEAAEARRLIEGALAAGAALPPDAEVGALARREVLSRQTEAANAARQQQAAREAREAAKVTLRRRRDARRAAEGS
jgi:hypothetical protein